MTKLSPLVLVTALAVTLPAQQFVADANAQLDEATIPHEVRTGAALDIDRDGDRDVLLIDGSILLNDGTGRFQRHPLLTLAADASRALQALDVDSDGITDIVTFTSTRAVLYRGTGSGGFLPPTTIHTTSLPTTTRLLFDADGDGDLDCFFESLFRNDGGGTFTQVPGVVPQLATATHSVAGDVDGDGDIDVIHGTGLAGFLHLLRNDGGLVFTDLTTAAFPGLGRAGFDPLFLVDMDRDGDLDLIETWQSGQGNLYRNDGAGVFRRDATHTIPFADAALMAVVDLDADGAAEIIVGRGESFAEHTATVWRNDGSGRLAFDPNSSVHAGIPLAIDVDGDGDLDLLSDARRVSWNDGGRRLTRGSLPFTGLVWTDLHGDLDRDGDLDLIADTRHLLANQGDGRFEPIRPSRYPLGDQRPLFASALEDFDGDGDLDLVFSPLGDLRYWLGDGRGGFTEAPGGAMPQRFYGIRQVFPADADGDGDLDLFVTGQPTSLGNRLDLYVNDGRGHFTARVIATNASALVRAFEDLDGDGNRDLLLSRPLVLLGDGRGGFATQGNFIVPDLQDAVGDFDGDGDLDYVRNQPTAASQGLGIPHIRWNDGAGNFSPARPVVSGPGADPGEGSLQAFDFEPDGDLDLILYSPNLGSVPLLNDGAGNFRVGPPARHTDGQLLGRPFDADGDGDLDFVRLGKLFRNRDVQLSAPQVAHLGADYPLVFHWRPGYGPTSGVFALAWLGLATLPNPVPLPSGNGLLRVDPGASLVFPLVQLDAQGTATHVHHVPNVVALGGLEICCQALFAPSANPVDWRLSGIVRDAVLR